MNRVETELPEFIRGWTAPFHVTMDGIKDANGCWICSATNHKLATQIVELMNYAAALSTPIAAAGGEATELAAFMLRNNFATGHGDTFADLLSELEAQVQERALQQKAWADKWDHADSALRAALSTAGAAEPVAWRSMDSAPKDGRNVLLCFHHHPVAIGRFEYNSWTYAFCVTEGGDSPTGWMPVPEKDRPKMAAEYTEGAALTCPPSDTEEKAP